MENVCDALCMGQDDDIVNLSAYIAISCVIGSREQNSLLSSWLIRCGPLIRPRVANID